MTAIDDKLTCSESIILAIHGHTIVVLELRKPSSGRDCERHKGGCSDRTGQSTLHMFEHRENPWKRGHPFLRHYMSHMCEVLSWVAKSMLGIQQLYGIHVQKVDLQAAGALPSPRQRGSNLQAHPVLRPML